MGLFARKQTWYADDAAATGKITDLRQWWDQIVSLGPSFGNSWLITKPEQWLLKARMCRSQGTWLSGLCEQVYL